MDDDAIAGISKVTFYVDGALCKMRTTSYRFSRDMTNYTNSGHSRFAVLYDTLGGTKTFTINTVNINNPVVDAVSITGPVYRCCSVWNNDR